MKIDELPNSVLENIFKYLSTYKRVSLVSRIFYDVALQVNDNNYLRLDHKLFKEENRPRLESIERTNKKVSTVQICFPDPTQIEIPTIISIVEKFSVHIKCLILYGTYSRIEMAQFLHILSLVPNAKILLIEDLELELTDHQPMPLTLNNEELNLKHLKSLVIFYIDIGLQVVFNRLPAGVLTELKMYNVELRRMHDLLNRQTNINKLMLYECVDDTQGQFFTDILGNLRLEWLECTMVDVETLASAVSRQTKLKFLKLGFRANDQVDENLMKKLANSLPELETLVWKFGETSVADFFYVGKFKNLKHLTLNFRDRLDIIESFTEMDNSRILTLEIKNVDDMSSETIHKLAMSAPQLMDLRFRDELSWKQAIAVLKHFNFVKCLTLTCIEEPDYDDYTNQNISPNPNLTDLKICFMSKHNSRVIEKFIADYPNLTALIIGLPMAPMTLYPIIAFRIILGGFRKLELLKLNFEKKLTIDDLQYLRDHTTKKLQFLSLRKIEKHFVDEHMEELEEIFEVVRFHRDTLIMAVDVKTMTRKMCDN